MQSQVDQDYTINKINIESNGIKVILGGLDSTAVTGPAALQDISRMWI